MSGIPQSHSVTAPFGKGSLSKLLLCNTGLFVASYLAFQTTGLRSLSLTLRPTLSQAQCSENVLVVLIPLGDKGSCLKSICGSKLRTEEFHLGTQLLWMLLLH